MSTLGVDIGGSSVKHGLVAVTRGRAAVVGSVQAVSLPDNEFGSLRAIVEDIVGGMHRHHDVTAVGISTTGSVDRNGTVVSAGHFNGYVNVSWDNLLRELFPALGRVATTNDGRAAAWAEFSASDRPDTSLVHAVVGTGVGGGIVYEGRLLLGDSGQSGYIGHLKVSPDSPVTCSCGSVGCVEALSSARAIAARFQDARLGPGAAASAFDAAVDAVANGDDVALMIFKEAAWWLGRGLGNAMNVINPAVVTVGGGVALAATEAMRRRGVEYLDAVREGIESSAHRRVFASAEVRAAEFGNDGGLVGAALLAT